VLLTCAGCGPAGSRTDTVRERGDQSGLSRARAEFNETFDRWKNLLGQLRDLELAFHTSGRDQRQQLAAEYNDKLANGFAMEEELLTSAARSFAAEPEENGDLREFLIRVSTLLVGAECYEDGLRVSQLLLDNQVETPVVYANAARAAFACSEFQLADKYLRIVVTEQGDLSQAADRLRLIEFYRKQWKREQELRQAEQLAADLPRVILRTERGEIELELFENEAPNTVANFIRLVEQGFYDDLPFYKVIPEFAALSGCPNGDGSGSPGYFLPHEFKRDDRRVHFRGSLSTVSQGAYANGSQFQLTFLPTPQLEGESTVFGRVVRGIEVLAQLQRLDDNPLSVKIRPDRILTARVLRKRNHPYKPKTIPDPKADERRAHAERMRRLLSR
jgi:cyclophilin family peptidyl-prolyl cis-trans isomerase